MPNNQVLNIGDIYSQIAEIIEKCLDLSPVKNDFTLEDVYETDKFARETVRNLIKG